MEVIGTQPTPVDPQDKAAPEILDALASYVMEQWNDAKDAREIPNATGYSLDERLLRCMRAVRREYNPDELALVDEMSDIYIGVTSKKQRAVKAWMKDILTEVGMNPATLEPTPIPDLPESQKEQIVEYLKRELIAMSTGPDGQPRELGDAEIGDFTMIAKQLKDRGMRRAFEIAKKATDRCERKIFDQLAQGGFKEALDDILDDIGTFPFTVIYGPAMAAGRKLEWQGKRLIDVESQFFQVRRVSPFDFYWSTDSTNCQNGRWVAEIAHMSVPQLYGCIGMDGVDDEAVRYGIQQYGDSGFRLLDFLDDERRRLEDKATFQFNRGTIDVLRYFGLVPGKYLQDNGMEVDDVDRYYETEVWVLNRVTIRAVFNAYPLGQRPYGKACYSNVPGSFPGESLSEILESVQRVCNATARSMVKNMAYASGPMGEVDQGRLADGESVDEMVPYQMIQTRSDTFGNQMPAVRFHKWPSITNELLNVQERYDKMADDESGIPAYAMGQAMTGGAGRTLGGLSLLMSNAAKGVKVIMGNVDKGIIEPVVMMCYNLIMLYDPDESLKADAQVIVMGASGLLQRENSQGRAMELVQLLQPYAGPQDPANPIIPAESIRSLLRQVTEPMGMMDIVPDPKQSLQYELSQLGGQSVSAATAPPRLDGRSTSQMRQ